MANKRKDSTNDNGYQQEMDVDDNFLNDILKSQINGKDSKQFYYNSKDSGDYKISSGSLILDDLVGLLSPGLIRACGSSRGGKSSCVLSYMKNFLETVPNARAVYFKAEGRFGDNIRRTTGIKFVEKENFKDWKDGTCFVVETNIYEGVFDLINSFITKDTGKRFFFFIDSIDALILNDDMAKGFSEASKVSGGAVISKLAMKKFCVPISSGGHYWAFTSQQVAKIKIGMAHQENQMAIDSSGGNAAIHFPDLILEFKTRGVNDYYFPSMKGKSGKREKYETDMAKCIADRPYGHNVNIIVKKSDENLNDVPINYPIRYDREPGKAVWWEKEVFSRMLYSNDFLNIAGAGWVSCSDFMQQIIKHYGFEEIPKTQGLDKLENYLNEKGIIKKFYELFKKEIAERGMPNGYVIGQEIDDDDSQEEKEEDSEQEEFDSQE